MFGSQLAASSETPAETTEYPLHKVVERNQFDLAELLLDHHCDVNSRTTFGVSALYVAALNNNYRMCELLVKHIAVTDVADHNGVAPLHLAAINGNIEIATLLLKNHCHPNIKTKDKTTPLLFAVQQNNYEMVDLLLQNLADVQHKMPSGGTSLHYAAKSGNEEMCQLLLFHHADPNVADEDGRYPLHYATELGHFGMTTLLINHAADPNVADKNGICPLHHAVNSGSYPVTYSLLMRSVDLNAETKEKVTSVFLAVANGFEELFFLLVSLGARVGPNVEIGGHTILSRAVLNGSYFIVEHILQRCVLDYEVHSSLLKLAVLNNGPNSCFIVQLLYRYGLSFSRDDTLDLELVIVLIKKGYSSLFEDLVLLGLDVNMPVKIYGQQVDSTLLHLATKHLQEEIIKLLVRNGAKTEVLDCHKKTPLLLVFQNLNNYELDQHLLCLCDLAYHPNRVYAPDIATFLLEWGASPNCRDYEGATPLHMSVIGQEFRLIKKLLRWGANPNLPDKGGRIPLHLAGQYGSFAIFEELLRCGSAVHLADVKGNTTADYIQKRDVRNTYLRYSRPSMFELLFQHYVVRLKAIGRTSNWLYARLPSNRSCPEFAGFCAEEIAKSKTDFIGDSSATFLDVLTATPAKISAFMRSKNVLAFLKSYDLKDNYPNYEPMLKHKLTLALNRRNFLDKAELMLGEILPSIPQPCIEVILSFLSPTELNHLDRLSKMHAYKELF